ncbi:enoyl-CoA hydratase/isomerase family protein [Hwanghaeella sp.]|uniref:enoyl-CoA hydratase/isomerase family protein n=1 Tax=Hwanghaeella sp. TaxID=2605943 RepID=UPI003CCB75F3
MSAEFEHITVSYPSEHVLLVTLNRPEIANAFNTRMAEELLDVWTGIAAAPETRCVVLTGAGNRAFCAGADLKERNGMSPEDWHKQHDLFERMAYALMDCPNPVIAAVNGAAYAGGFELVLASDFAYGAPSSRFALTEVTLGLIPGIGGTQNLPRAIGLRRAKEVLLSGRPFSSDQALDWGVLNRICDRETLLPDALATARQIAGNAPLAVRQAMAAMDGGIDQPLAEARRFEIDCYNTLIDTEDRREGIAAFNEKRKPDFKGR